MNRIVFFGGVFAGELEDYGGTTRVLGRKLVTSQTLP